MKGSASRHAAFATAMLCIATPAFSATPLLDFVPVPPVPHTVTQQGTAIAKYVVTSRTSVTRSWRLVTRSGVEQVTTGGACASPFVLARNQHCVLTLAIHGVQLQGDLFGGPIVCVANDSSQCVMPDPADGLDVHLDTDTLFADGFDDG